MLDVFITAQRGVIISRAKARVVSRRGAKADLPDGIPAFLDQLVAALRLADSTDKIEHEQIRKSAARQGGALFSAGATIEEVVHEYGDVCQTITEVAIEQNTRVPTAEFRVMNLCLDDAIAQAVTEFAGRRLPPTDDPGSAGLDKLGRELLGLVATAKTSFEIIKSGHVAPAGSTGMVLEGSLTALSAVIERGLLGGASTPS